jgi:hypothetical protein
MVVRCLWHEIWSRTPNLADRRSLPPGVGRLAIGHLTSFLVVPYGILSHGHTLQRADPSYNRARPDNLGKKLPPRAGETGESVPETGVR